MRAWLGIVLVSIAWLVLGVWLYSLELGLLCALITFVVATAFYLVPSVRRLRQGLALCLVMAAIAPIVIGAALIAIYQVEAPDCEGSDCTTVTVRISNP